MLSRALEVADRGERAKIYAQAEKLIVEDAPWIFVVNDLQPMAYSKKLKGYTTNPAYVINFNPIYIEK